MAGEPSLFLVYQDFNANRAYATVHGMGHRLRPTLPRPMAAPASAPTRARSRSLVTLCLD